MQRSSGLLAGFSVSHAAFLLVDLSNGPLQYAVVGPSVSFVVFFVTNLVVP